ncbi:MAG: hypothetical protein Q4C96_00900 [Planctomycetia bacterium]|nr:hypothetical protein [Planctomycetia bacterium]
MAEEISEKILKLEASGAKIRKNSQGAVIAVDARNTDITGEYLPEMPFLRDLKLTGPQVTDITMQKLFAFSSLTSLSLDKTGITDKTLISQISRLPKLQQLFLSGVKITDSGVKVLAKNKNFIRIRLAGTQITDASLEILSEMSALRSLDLSNTKISVDGLSKLVTLSVLEDINIYNAKYVGGEVTEIFAEMDGLQKINMDNIPVTDADVEKLLPLAENLIFLHLGGTRITDKVVNTLEKFKKLKTLYVNRTEVTDVGVAQLRKSLPECNIITCGGEERQP